VDAIVAEVEDHLYSTVERFEAGGIDADLAQRAALERFGDPDLVARAYAATPNGGLAVPTKSTRIAGTFAIVSGALWLVVIGTWWLAGMLEPRYDLQSGASAISYDVGAAALLGATAFMAAALRGLDRRHGGLGTLGAAGLVIAGAGLIGSFLAWVFTGWGTMTMFATILSGAAMWRRDLVPRAPIALIAGGPLVGAVAWAGLRSSSGPIDLSGLWGVHWFENQLGLTVGVLILAIGLVGVGRWLRSEEPTFIDEQDRPLAV
jgi:hypothetical protein